MSEQDVNDPASGWRTARAATLLVRGGNVESVGLEAMLRQVRCVHLEDVRDFEWVLSARPGTTQADIVILAGAQGASVVEAARWVRRLMQGCKIVVVDHEPDPDVLLTLARVPIVAYLVWRDVTQSVLDSTLSAVVEAGVIVVSAQAAAHALAWAGDEWSRHRRPAGLTERQIAVLRHLAEGMLEDEIARIEGLSLRAVERAIRDSKDELDAPTMFVLGQRAHALGIGP